MTGIDAFAHQKYLNLETFRRSGEGVQTPVWFAQEGELLYVLTLARSGKVKRVRRNGTVNVAPCRMDGRLVGTWTPAQAREKGDPEVKQKVNRMLDRKYGLMRRLFTMRRADRAGEATILEIQLVKPADG